MFFELVQPRKVENEKPEAVKSKPTPKPAKPAKVVKLLGSQTKKWRAWAKQYKGTWVPGQEPPCIEPLPN